MARKRGNGEGSIYFSDKLNRWVGQFTAGVKNDGKPNRKSVYGKTRKEVAEKINKALNEIKEHKFVDKSDVTFLELLTSIVEDKHNSNITNDSTYRRDLYTVEQITNSPFTFAHKSIQRITNSDIKKFFFSITNYSNSSIDKIYRLINSTFKKAVYMKYRYDNPLDNRHDIIKPKSETPDKKVEALTIQEHQRLLEVFNNEEKHHKYRNIILLTLALGLRIGETLALNKVKHIDLTTEYIYIKRCLTRNTKSEYILPSIDKAKTYNSIRDIKLNPFALEILSEVLKTWIPNKENLLFWDYEKDNLITPTQVLSYLSRVNEKYHICDHVTNHMLRHTYATRCIESGMTAVVLAKKLGHKDVSITLNTYTSIFSKYEDTQDDRYISYMREKVLKF